MAFDEKGNPIEEEQVPDIVDKLKPIQAMSKRRAVLDMRILSRVEDSHEERRIFIDALEYIEIYSEDVFARLMARTALSTRPR